jgi:hypothetical protein
VPQRESGDVGPQFLIVGGQGQFVQLTSTNVSYDAGTQIFQADITVQNLIGQALGTPDGSTVTGVKVFFHEGPIVTAGTGTVAVANPDGFGTFTGSNQAYHEYDEILVAGGAPPPTSGATSQPKTWQFSASPNISFEFSVFVEADVEHPDGWVEVAPAIAEIAVDQVLSVSAVVRDVVGRAVSGQTVTWSSDDEAVATVDPTTGLVTGVAAGTTTITATSGSVSGTMEITVHDLGCGYLISDAIQSAAEVDIFTFGGSVGDVVLLTAGETGGFSGSVSASVQLLSPSLSQVIAFNTNGQQQVALPEEGTYRIRVNAADLTSTGSYNLGLECIAPLGPVEAALVPGDLVSEALNDAAEVDVYSFAGQTGDEVLLTVGETGGFSGSSNAYVRLLSPTLVEVTTLTTSGQAQVTLPESGTYVITVTGNGGGVTAYPTGTYNLSYERLQPLGPVEAALVPGDLVSEALNDRAEVDVYSFAGQTGDEVLLTVGETGGFSGSSNAYVRLLSPTLVEVTTFTTNGQVQVTLPESGTYVITVTGNGGGVTAYPTGTYNLSYERLQPLGPVEAALTSGDLVSEALNDAAEVDVYSFAGQTGDVILLTVSETGGFSGTSSARVRLLSPTLVEVTTFTTSGQAQVTLPESGTYVITVTGNGGGTTAYPTGTYNLSYQQL